MQIFQDENYLFERHFIHKRFTNEFRENLNYN